MVLLFLILPDGSRLDDVLEAYLEVGITGATVLDARGMGQILSEEVPIFAGLRSLFPGGETAHHLILSVAEEDKAREALELIQGICGDLGKKGTGIAFTVPVTGVMGLAKEL